MKMKITLIALSSLLALNSVASEDLLLQTRLDQKSASWLIDKVRLILTNSNLSDGMSDTTPLTEDTIIPLDEFAEGDAFQRLKTTIASVFKVDAKGAFLRIRIPKIYYKVHTLHARPESAEVVDPTLRLRAIARLQGVDLALTEGIQLDFMIPNRKSGIAEAYLTGSLKPVSIEIPKGLDPAEFQVDLEATRDEEFRFKLISARLDSLPGYVTSHLKEIKFLSSASQKEVSADDLTINPVVVRLNSLSRSITFDEFKPLFQKNLRNIITSVVNRVGNELKESIGPAILKVVFSKTLPSSLALSTEALYTRYLTTAFSQPDRDQLTLGVRGELCTLELFNQYQEACAGKMRPSQPVRNLSLQEDALAKEELRLKIASGTADVALSVSEEYLNRLLQATIDAKLWDEMLREENLELGPKGAFVVMKDSGRTPQVYLDVIYKGGKGLQSVVINPRHPIRFPLRLSTSIRFENRRDIPVIVIGIEKLMSDSSEIINGIRDFDLPSDLVPGLRRKIASMILKMASALEGRNAVEMQLPVFKGLGLEASSSETSAHGRLNLFFKI